MTTDEGVVDVSQDWELACSVQQRFMQGLYRCSGRMDFYAECRQVRALGGDCYDCMPLSEHRVALVVGDASGKGVAAALMMASVQAMLKTASLFTGDNLSALFRLVNLQAYESSLSDRYATVFYGIFDRQRQTLQYLNAGHTPPVILRHDGSVQRLEPNAAPLGMFPDSRYEESVAELNPGDLLIACTDGITEAANGSGEEWGVEGLLKAAGNHRAESAKDLVLSLFESMDGFSRGSQTDDATLAVLRAL